MRMKTEKRNDLFIKPNINTSTRACLESAIRERHWLCNICKDFGGKNFFPSDSSDFESRIPGFSNSAKLFSYPPTDAAATTEH